jgi:hypothetical protein
LIAAIVALMGVFVLGLQHEQRRANEFLAGNSHFLEAALSVEGLGRVVSG